ncbi:MAG: type II CAAX endopeptidase family protein [Chloroflexota bacterium]
MTDAGPDLEVPLEGPASTFGLFRFTIDGRQAPGLFVAGWIALVVGASASFVGLLAGRNLAGTLLFAGGMAIILIALVFLGGSQAIERRASSAAYAGPSPILTFAAVIVGWYLTAIAVGTPLRMLGMEVEGPALALLGVAIQGVVVVLLLRVMVVGTDALSWSDMGLRRPDRAAIREFGLGALLAWPVVLATALVVIVLVGATGQQPSAPLPATGSSSGLLLNLLAGALIAPVYEELFFRGFTQTAWRRMAGPTRAIIRSTLLFALVHAIDQSGDTFAGALGVAVVATGARLPVALVLGLVFDRRRSLWASIGLHATFNGILLIVAEQALRA